MGIFSTSGCFFDTLQASLLDLGDLSTDEPPAFHIATQLSQRVGWARFSLRRAQAIKTFGGLLELGIEPADAEPDQRCPHAIDDPVLLSNKALALAVRSLGIFVLDGRDRDHLAVIALAP